MHDSTKLGLFLLVLLFSVPLVTFGLEEVTYTFGISLGLNRSQAGTYGQVQYDNLDGFEIWRDWWNAKSPEDRTTKYGVTFKVALHNEDYSDFVNGTMYGLFQAYERMKSYGNISFYFVPTTTPWDIETRNYTYYELGIPFMVASGDSSERYYATPGSFGAPTANILSLSSWLPYLRVARAKKLAVIKANENFQRELCEGIINNAALNDVEIVSTNTMPFNYSTPDKRSDYGDPNLFNRRALWEEVLEKVIASEPDAVAICDFGVGSEFALNYFRQKNWTPKAILISTLINAFKDPSLLNYVTLPSSYHPKARFPVQHNFTDSAGYDVLCAAKAKRPCNYLIARATVAGMIFTNAIMQAVDNSSQAIYNALATSQFPSFMGTSAFDPAARQTRASLVLQMIQNNTDALVIGPAQASRDAYVFPMPTWEERIFNVKWGSPVEIVGAVLMAVGGAVTVGWVIFLIMHRNHRVMVAASPVFCYTILAGSLLVYISIFSWMPNLINDSICNLRPWLLPLGFMTMFGSLLAKTHRIYRLYYANTITIMRISNLQVALTILLIVVAQSILSILMVTVTDLKAQLTIVDSHRISKNYWVCFWPNSLRILFGVNVGFAVILLAWGTFLAYRIRKVPISIYDESKVIAFSIYNTAFFGAIVIVIQLAVANTNRDVTFIITAICCFLGATITTSCLFAAKWYAIYGPSKTSLSRASAGGTSDSALTSSSSRSGGRDGSVARDHGANSDDKKRYKKKISDLKEKNNVLVLRIKELESLAKSNGFLKDGDVEMATSPKHKADGSDV